MAANDVFLMCRPDFYRVAYVINPWMEGNIGRTDAGVAQQQWEALRAALATMARVEIVEPAAAQPDMPFTANAGLVVGDRFAPSHFRFPQRQGETALFTAWFRRHGYRLVEFPDHGTFEGEGDALFQPGERLLWGGYGVRSSLQVYEHLADVLDVEVVPLRLIDERFYHLDTCFCPLPDGRLFYYPEAFDGDALAAIAARVPEERRYAVGPTDAVNFACNAVVVADAVVTNFASEALRVRLAQWGWRAVVCPVREFQLAGGGAKCLVLRLTHELPLRSRREASSSPGVQHRTVVVQGHLLDTGFLNRVLDCITEAGGDFAIEQFRPGLRHDEDSVAQVSVAAPSAERLEAILGRLIERGVRVSDERDARLDAVGRAGVAPDDFYSTTIFPTDVRVRGQWIRASGQRMDAVLTVDATRQPPRVRCTLLRDLQRGDQVVCGVEGVRIHPPAVTRGAEPFAFMRAGTSSERRVEVTVERIAWEMHRLRARHGKIVVVPGPVVIHTGGGPHLAALVRAGFVQALLSGNGFAAHDIEQALFGTALGVDLRSGTNVQGGHRHHLKAINTVRACGGIGPAVAQGVLRSGVLYECARRTVPVVLAGSIRDDGPLPETLMDLLAAQRAYAEAVAGADMILMLASMLHAIGVGNMTPAGVRLICVDISAPVVTKLADRGSIESTGIVTDVGLFLELLAGKLAAIDAAGAPLAAGVPER